MKIRLFFNPFAVSFLYPTKVDARAHFPFMFLEFSNACSVCVVQKEKEKKLHKLVVGIFT